MNRRLIIVSKHWPNKWRESNVEILEDFHQNLQSSIFHVNVESFVVGIDFVLGGCIALCLVTK